MNSQQLSCFIGVADKLSFSRAAKELFLSVPTVTHHIKTLENELNTILFIRDNHKVILTDNGKSFYEEAKKIIKIENDYKESLSKNDNKETIRIACTAYGELILISSIIKELKNEYPNLIPEINVRSYYECIYLLKQQSVDIMLGSDNMIINENDLFLKHPIKQTSYLIINKNNPLSKKSNISLNDLDNQKIIRIDNNLIPFYSTNIMKDYINIHSGRSNDLICHDELICLSLVESNIGVTILPEYRIPGYIKNDILIKPIKDNESFKYGLILNNSNKSNIVNEFINEFNKQVKIYSFK